MSHCLKWMAGYSKRVSECVSSLSKVASLCVSCVSCSSCDIESRIRLSVDSDIGGTFLCCLRSIVTHRDHFVRLSVCLSVRPPVCPSVCHTRIAMFRRRHMHSLEYCHYFFSTLLTESVLLSVLSLSIATVFFTSPSSFAAFTRFRCFRLKSHFISNKI